MACPTLAPPGVEERFLDLPAVLRKVPACRSTIYKWMEDGIFPRGRRIGRRRLWREAVIDDFIRRMPTD